MVTNYPQQLTASTRIDTQNAETMVNRAVSRVSQFLCGLRGHDAVLHFEGKRVNMRCTSCGHDTPGWEVTGRGPRQRYEGDARRHVLVPQRRLVLRKTA
jgi:NAD-dependent SIR2 family protein deacetylase